VGPEAEQAAWRLVVLLLPPTLGPCQMPAVLLLLLPAALVCPVAALAERRLGRCERV